MWCLFGISYDPVSQFHLVSFVLCSKIYSIHIPVPGSLCYIHPNHRILHSLFTYCSNRRYYCFEVLACVPVVMLPSGNFCGNIPKFMATQGEIYFSHVLRHGMVLWSLLPNLYGGIAHRGDSADCSGWCSIYWWSSILCTKQ